MCDMADIDALANSEVVGEAVKADVLRGTSGIGHVHPHPERLAVAVRELEVDEEHLPGVEHVHLQIAVRGPVAFQRLDRRRARRNPVGKAPVSRMLGRYRAAPPGALLLRGLERRDNPVAGRPDGVRRCRSARPQATARTAATTR